MNANEVIANRALEILGRPKGSYSYLHPNEDVNRSQSTNDVYPTALKIAAITAGGELIHAMRHLRYSFERKAVEFEDVVKVGRTQLQDAVPMTLGQEFASYAVMIGEDELRLGEALVHLHEINLGATAIGTGITAPLGYAEAARRNLQCVTGLPVATAPNLVESTQDCGAFVLYSGTLKRAATKNFEDMQRLAAAFLRSSFWPVRNRLAPKAGWLQHHAREGQPCYSRDGQSGRVRDCRK